MKAEEAWKPSKFLMSDGRLVASSATMPGSKLYADRLAEVFGQGIPIHARGALLDLACGAVPLYQAYRPFVESVFCVDWNNSLHSNAHLDLECDLTKPLPLDDSRFDTIILSSVLEHIPEPEQLWSEMARVLRPGGKIILSVPFYYWLHEQPHDYYRYTEFALRRFASMAGLEIRELTPFGGAPEIVADIVLKSILHLPRMGHRLSRLFGKFAEVALFLKFVREVSEVTAADFPFGYFLVVQKPDL